MRYNCDYHIIIVRCLLFLAAVISPTLAFANIADYQFENYSLKDGLAQSTVIDIAEDQHGFIWFGTGDGLNRFDGYEFIEFRQEIGNTSSLPSSFIRALYIDSKKRLWIGTDRGLARFDDINSTFVNYNTPDTGLTGSLIWTIAEDHKGNLLVSDETGLYKLIDSKFEPFKEFQGQLPKNIKTISSLNHQTFFGSFGEGIHVLNHNTLQLSRYNLWYNGDYDPPEIPNYIIDFEVINGELWIASENGLWVTKNDTITHHFSINSESPIAGSYVRKIAIEDNKNVWLATDEGVSIIDTNNMSVVNLTKESSWLTGFNGQLAMTVFEDKNSRMWVGSDDSGLFLYYGALKGIKHYEAIEHHPKALSGNTIWGIQEDSKKNIWLITQSNGLNKFSKEKNEFERYLKNLDINLWDLAIDEADRLFLATDKGIMLFEQYNDQQPTISTLLTSQLGTYDILLGKHNLYIASQDGLLHSIDLSTLNPNHIKIENSPSNSLRPIYFDRNEMLWIETENGFVVFNVKKQQALKVFGEFEGFKAVEVFDHEESINVVGEFGQILTFDASNYQLVEKQNLQFAEKAIKVSAVVKNDEQLWISNDQGVLVFSLNDYSLLKRIGPKFFDFSEWTEFTSFLDSNGNVYFGSTRGFHVLNPKMILKPSPINSYNTLLTELRIFNDKVENDTLYSTQNLPIYRASEITLQYEETPFSLTFGQQANGHQMVNYRYKLIGQYENWLTVPEGQRQATFTNLDFGSYQFEVQSRLENGEWTDSRILKINVLPPFWLSTPAISLYCLVFAIVAGYLTVQYRSKRRHQKMIQVSEERLSLSLWSSGDQLWDWNIATGKIHRSNEWEGCEFPNDNVRVVSDLGDNIHPDDKLRVKMALRKHLQGQSEQFQSSYRVKDKDGNWIWVLDRGKVVKKDSDDVPVRMTGTLKDISHIKKSEKQLRLFQRSIENISDGVFITDQKFKIISVNKAYCDITGQTQVQALNTYIRFKNYPQVFTEEVKKCLRVKNHWSGEIESTKDNGDKFTIDLHIDSLFEDDGSTSHYVGVFSDITMRKQTEKELIKLANSDPLTGLPNRSFFQASHENLIRKQEKHALLCLDLDNFKKINDSMGHQVGDILLQQVAKRILKLSDSTMTCYRLGGDEFALLIEKNPDVTHVSHFAQTLIDEMQRPFMVKKEEFVLGASIGITFHPNDGASTQEMLRNADTAMYFAKNRGGNRYKFFSEELNQNAVRQLQIENLVRRGLREKLFNVYYQPKVDLKTGNLAGMEALVRFEHPEKGLVSPGQFIPLAEETGQIIEIGEQVLEKACRDTQRWVQEGLFTGRVAVNISAKQFEQKNFADRVQNILKQTGLSPLHLECEITEGILIDNPEDALKLMDQLRFRGIHLTMDDFGTGYSSLAYLKRFPINTLKIDKAFIDDMADNVTDKNMVESIINIAHNLGLKVVAEGVEAEAQLTALREFDCEMIQGYLFSRPLSSAKFEKLLRENLQIQKLLKQPAS